MTKHIIQGAVTAILFICLFASVHYIASIWPRYKYVEEIYKDGESVNCLTEYEDGKLYDMTYGCDSVVYEFCDGATSTTCYVKQKIRIN